MYQCFRFVSRFSGLYKRVYVCMYVCIRIIRKFTRYLILSKCQIIDLQVQTLLRRLRDAVTVIEPTSDENVLKVTDIPVCCLLGVQLPPIDYRWPVASVWRHIAPHVRHCLNWRNSLTGCSCWPLSVVTKVNSVASDSVSIMSSLGVATLRQWLRLVSMGSSWNDESRHCTFLVQHVHRDRDNGSSSPLFSVHCLYCQKC